MHNKLSHLIFASLLGLGAVSQAAANPGGQHAPRAEQAIRAPHGTPLKKPLMRRVKGLKASTYRKEGASLQVNPPRVDPVDVTTDAAHGETLVLHEVVTHGIDYSERSVKDKLTPDKVRTALTGRAVSQPVVMGKIEDTGPGATTTFPISHAANRPMVGVFTSADVAYAGKTYRQVFTPRGKRVTYKIDKSGTFPALSFEGGQVAGDFEPYLNENVIGVSPAYYPSEGKARTAGQLKGELVAGDGAAAQSGMTSQHAGQHPGQHGAPTGKPPRKGRVVVRGGVNAIPPGAQYRMVNLTTGELGSWTKQSGAARTAHEETGSFRDSVAVESMNDELAIDVRTGNDKDESAIITKRFRFRAGYQEGLEGGDIPLLAGKFAAEPAIVDSAPHPVSGKAYKDAKAAIAGKIEGGKTFEEMASDAGLIPAASRELAVLLQAHGDKFTAVTATGPSQFRLTDAAGAQQTISFRSTLASARSWTLDAEPGAQ